MGEGWFTTERYTTQRDDALRRFGAMLRRWRLRNGWTQYTPSKWGKEAGFHAMAAGNLSNLENGKAGNPAPSTIFQLADINRRVATQDWGPVQTRALMDQLQSAAPILSPTGEPWGPTEFWACSVGVLAPPADLDAPVEEPAPQLSDEQAAELSQRWRAQLAEWVLRQDLDPSEALMDVAKAIPQQHRKRLRQVLGMPGREYSAAELQELWANGWLPEQALQAWAMQKLHVIQPQP